MKKFSILLTFVTFFLLIAFTHKTVFVYAQTSQQATSSAVKSAPWITKVGNPKGPPPTTTQAGTTLPGIGPLAGAVEAASQIIGLLSKGSEGYYNGKADEPGVYYWCTYLIVDSFNRAGITGLSRAAHAAVLNMKSFFANTSGYRLLSSDTTVEQLQPGNVVFFEGSGNQHVSLIKSFDLDENGNGAIKTYDSNNVVTEDTIFVVNHKATKAHTTARLYQITGFGQAI